MSGEATANARFNAQVFTQVINLDRSVERMAAIAAGLDRAGIAYVRLSAVDGRKRDLDHDPEVRAMFDLKAWARRHHRNPTHADVGCYMSHYRAIEAFSKQDRPFGLIFEDDADVAPNFIAVANHALEDSALWDIMKFHARHPGPLLTRRSYADGVRLCSFVARHAGGTSYMINHAAAKKMLKHLVPAVRMIDWAYDQGHIMKLRVRTLSPMPVGLQQVASTIEVERGDKKKRTWLQRQADPPYLPRWQLPFRRIGDEIHRFAFNMLGDGGLRALMFGPDRS